VSTTGITPDRIPAGVSNVDPAHSNVSFEVRHMGIATVRDTFRSFAGTIDATGDAPVLKGTAEIASIDTGEEHHDGHLKSPDLLDAEQHPQITFGSAETGANSGETVTLAGEITIKGVTKPLELTGTIAENGEDPWGNQRVGFELEAKIDRRDFDLNFNQTLPNGLLLLSNDVKLLVGVSAVKGS